MVMEDAKRSMHDVLCVVVSPWPGPGAAGGPIYPDSGHPER